MITFFSFSLLFASTHRCSLVFARAQPFILCKNFVLVVSSFFPTTRTKTNNSNKTRIQKKHTEKEAKNCNSMSTSNCAFITGIAKRILPMRIINSTHMSNYTILHVHLIYWLSLQKFVSCQAA